MSDKLKQMNAYFVAHKSLTLTLLWVCLALSLGYAFFVMYVMTSWNFWLMLIPGALALYFRLIYSKAAYDPRKDKNSDQYIPYSERPENKHKANRKTKK